MKANALWHMNENHSEILEESLLHPSSNDMIFVKSAFSSISLGTEKLVATGKIPTSMYNKMQVPYMAGRFDFPVKYGYSLVGQTENNQWVHLMHPHQNNVTAARESCYFLSRNTDPIVATQISNLETVVNAIWVSNVKKDDNVLVTGTGSVGILLAKALKNYVGAKVFINETNGFKQDKLKDLGFELCDLKNEYDCCFNVSSSQKGLQYCIDHCKTEGKIIELSWYGNQAVSIRLGENFHFKRLQIISSQVSEIPIAMSGQFNFTTRKELVEKLIQTVDFKSLITKIIPFEELPVFFNTIRNNENNNDFITLVKY